MLYKALIAALKEATEIVDKDRQEPPLLDRDVNSNYRLRVTAVYPGPQVRWTMAPENP